MNPENDRGYPRNTPNTYPKLNNDSAQDKSDVPKNPERFVLEMRKRSPNTTPASTVLNSPDLTEVHYSQNHQHQIRVGRSPVSQHANHTSSTSPGSPTDVGKVSIGLVREGEIVVFDDIDTNWIKTPETEISNEDVLKVTKMIGQLPIAEYEGSPRRIGNHQYDMQQKNFQTESVNASTPSSLIPPRPGFPQRVSTNGHETEASNNDELDDPKNNGDNVSSKTPAFDYLYEFSETRKVLEEFFKCPAADDEKKFSDCAESDDLGSYDQDYARAVDESEKAYIGQRLARIQDEEFVIHKSSSKRAVEDYDQNDFELYIDSNSRSSGEIVDTELAVNVRRHSRNFTLSPETTDYDSNCGDLDSLSNDMNCQTDFGRLYTSMPVLEDGLSSGHASDTENNLSVILDRTFIEMTPMENVKTEPNCEKENSIAYNDAELTSSNNVNHYKNNKDSKYEQVHSIIQSTPPPSPAPVPVRAVVVNETERQDIQEALKDIRSILQRTKTLPGKTKYSDESNMVERDSPVWVPRNSSPDESVVAECTQKDQVQDEEEADTDLETDRLLGQQRLDDKGFYDDKSCGKASRLKSPINSTNMLSSVGVSSPTGTNHTIGGKSQTFSSATVRQGIGTSLTSPAERGKVLNIDEVAASSPENLQYTKSPTGSIKSKTNADIDPGSDKKSKSRNKEALLDPAVLIEGVLFRARYLGSTQLVCEGQPTKSTRMMQAEEAVSRIKAPEGESQPSAEVDLFISTEKIMVLNTDLKEIMMDHALRTISYIADIGDLVVLMARRRFVPSENDENVKPNRTPKMICHVFESDEAQFIAQSIGQAFQVAYMEFLKANGIEDHSFVKEMDYQEVLNSQEIFGDELEIFAKKELQKEVVVPKAKGEILGVVIVESGWGSMLPTVVIANLMSSGAAARCGQLNIGDQLIAINGMSLVGLPLSTCQNYIRNTKNQTAVKFTVVPCPPVVEVKIKRPNTKYQLGFSVQNGVICSLLRGGIAERGGVRVGHRIIEINNQSVVAVPHEKIVNLLATSVGEILMKTMPTSMFRLLTGQENPIYI